MTRVQLTQRERSLFALLCVGLLALLVVAGILEPSASGLGTHRQLGLPPCTFLTVFQVPCPSCGMTTSWSYFVRGRFVEAWASNAGGACLALTAVLASGWSGFVALRGQRRVTWHGRPAWALGVALLTVTLLDWISRLL